MQCWKFYSDDKSIDDNRHHWEINIDYLIYSESESLPKEIEPNSRCKD